MIGALLQPRRPRMTSVPSMSGSPRSRMTRSGGSVAAALSAARPGGGGDDLVAARAEVDGERPEDLRLVVDDQDAGHERLASRVDGRDDALALPQPRLGALGVVGGLGGGEREHHRESAARCLLRGQCAVHRLDEPAGEGQPEADPGRVVGVTEALEGCEDPVQVLRRDAGAAVDHPQLDTVAEAAAGELWRLAGGAVAAAFPARLATTRSSRPGRRARGAGPRARRRRRVTRRPRGRRGERAPPRRGRPGG